MVRALASHQCGLGSIPRPGAICGLSLLLVLSLMCIGKQGWRSGESARLPPMWPGFDSRTRRHMWVEFVVGSQPCLERFFSGYSGFPLSSKTNVSKFQFDLESTYIYEFLRALRCYVDKYIAICQFL